MINPNRLGLDEAFAIMAPVESVF